MEESMRRTIIVFGATLALAMSLASPAFAGGFGPGNSGDHGTQKCHPPGQTKDAPGCH
jgi:hypothetical protein